MHCVQHLWPVQLLPGLAQVNYIHIIHATLHESQSSLTKNEWLWVPILLDAPDGGLLGASYYCRILKVLRIITLSRVIFILESGFEQCGVRG